MRAGEAAGKVAEIAHQVHGAMGFTQEHPLHFATRRLWSWRDEFGSEALWQERIGRLVIRYPYPFSYPSRRYMPMRDELDTHFSSC